MGADGCVIILDKKKADEFVKKHNLKSYFYDWYVYEIYGHEVYMTYVGDYPEHLDAIPCPFCDDIWKARDCSDKEHWEWFYKLREYAEVGTYEVWT